MIRLKSHTIWFLLIFILSFILRFYRLGEIPVGFHHDEISQAYNSYSILKTGDDRYGKSFPILFRSFGSYQPPVYTYLSTIPMALFGNTIFSARFMSALSGALSVLMTYLIVNLLLGPGKGAKPALFSSLAVGISPWAIHFSRRVVEANVGLFFFLLALYLLLLARKKILAFPLAAVAFGISTHAYYSERIITILAFPLLLLLFRRFFCQHKRWLVLGLSLFILIQIPHVITIMSGAFARRFDQVSYFGDEVSGSGKIPFVVGQFLTHAVGYLSPHYLFSDTGGNLGRVSPDLSVFYGWFFIPLLLGIRLFIKWRRTDFVKTTVIIAPVFLIPAALTGDVFYPLRALEYFWFLSLIVGCGLSLAYDYVKSGAARTLLLTLLIVYSLTSFYVSYFILFKYETTESSGYSYLKLVEVINKLENKKIIVDSTRDYAVGLRIAYLNKIPPVELQKMLKPQMKSDYYSSSVNADEIYKIGNIETRPIDWTEDIYIPNAVFFGDQLLVDKSKIGGMGLEEKFVIPDIKGNPYLFGYEVDKKKCKH